MSNHGRSGLPDWLRTDSLEDVLVDLLTFAAIIVAGILAGRGGRYVYQHSLRKIPTSGEILFGKMMVLIASTTALLMALSLVYGVQPLSMLATLGVLSLALGFGMQNTVANVAAGVGLSLDKPFDVGDRIRIGETWGDVVSVGLRSTRIMTVNGELVVVPNSILDTRELWNYTFQENTKFRLDLPISITYNSSLRLAESLLLEVARSDEGVLAYPEPVTRLMKLGESGQDLQLRVWINQADHRPAVRDRLLRGIKDRFDEAGVLFAFPQRTITRPEDLPEPRPTPDFVKGEARDKPVVLALAHSQESAANVADAVVRFAQRLDARLLALHVRSPMQAMNPYDAQAALNIYLDKAHRAGVPARAQSEVGELPVVLRRVARESDAKLVLFGRVATNWLGWVRHDVAEAQAACPVPVLTIEGDQDFPPSMIERWRTHVRPKQPPSETDQVVVARPARTEGAEGASAQERREPSDTRGASGDAGSEGRGAGGAGQAQAGPAGKAPDEPPERDPARTR